MRCLLDGAASELRVEGRSSLHPVRVASRALAGELELDLDRSGAVRLDRPATGTLSLPAASLRSGNPLTDAELARRMEVGRYPEIAARLLSLSAGDGPGRYRAEGEIVVRALTLPASGTLEVSLEDGAVVLAGELSLDVREFGLQPPRIGLLKVHPTVVVHLSARATPA